MSADNTSAWVAALDTFEMQVEHAERMVRMDTPGEPAAPWTPPRDLGPLPAALRERAQSLLERIHAAQTGLRAAAERARDESNRVPSVPVTGESAPVYVDLNA